MTKGWRRESARHSLARKGIKTGKKFMVLRGKPRPKYKMDEEALLDYAAYESGEARGFFLQEGEVKGLKGEALEEYADEKEAELHDEIEEAIRKDPYYYFVTDLKMSKEAFLKDPRFKRIHNPKKLKEEYTISEIDDFPNETFEDKQKAIKHAEKTNGQIYTQVDAGEDRVYLKGLHLVNRTGIYAVVERK